MTEERSGRPVVSPWLTITQGAAYAQVGRKTLYREVRAGRLRAARVAGRRELRVRREWMDAWLEASSTKKDDQ